MNPQPITQNTLLYGDNLIILREHIPDESVDLIFLWMILVAFAPFRCAHRYCGYRTWNPKNMRKHVEGKHSFAP
jgi:hypothetical protein